MIVEDGKGKGVAAEVSAENRLHTEAVTHSPQMHASFTHARAFQAVTGVQQVTSAGVYNLLSMKNDGEESLAITYIRVGVDRIEVLQAKLQVMLGGVWDGTGGTDAEVHNMHGGSSFEPEVTAQYGIAPTDPSVIDTKWIRGPNENTWNKEGAIILPQGGIIAVRVTTETDLVNVHGRISFFVIPKALGK